jgi:hypothetical protein
MTKLLKWDAVTEEENKGNRKWDELQSHGLF